MQQLGYLKETPSQTAGPYVHIGLTPNFCDITGVYDSDLGVAMVNDKTLGERITVTGRIFDGAGALVRDAVVEIWQADGAGLYNSPSEMRGAADPNFTGWGRCPTRAEDGVYSFETIKPRPRPLQGRPQTSPAHHCLDRRPRHQYRPADAHVFPRGVRGQRRRSAAVAHRTSRTRRDDGRHPRRCYLPFRHPFAGS